LEQDRGHQDERNGEQPLVSTCPREPRSGRRVVERWALIRGHSGWTGQLGRRCRRCSGRTSKTIMDAIRPHAVPATAARTTRYESWSNSFGSKVAKAMTNQISHEAPRMQAAVCRRRQIVDGPRE